MRSHLVNDHQPDLEIIAVAHRRALWARRTDIILRCRRCGELDTYVTGDHLVIEGIMKGEQDEDSGKPRG